MDVHLGVFILDSILCIEPRPVGCCNFMRTFPMAAFALGNNTLLEFAHLCFEKQRTEMEAWYTYQAK